MSRLRYSAHEWCLLLRGIKFHMKTDAPPKYNPKDKSATWTFTRVEDADAEVKDCELTHTPYRRISPLIVREWPKFE